MSALQTMERTLFRISKKAILPPVKPKFLEGIRVMDMNHQMVLVSDLWAKNTVVLKVLRRFGCPLCRYESRLLSELKPEFDALGIKLVAIGFEAVGLDDFMSGGYWDWDILIDSERTIHTALGLKKVSVSVGLKDLVSAATRAAILASRRVGITGDRKGDDLQLGGTFVVEKETSRVLYEHFQTGAGSYTSIKEIYESCGGDPDEVEEKAPLECLVFKRVCAKEGKCFKR